MSSRKEDLRVREVPDILRDPTSRKKYQKGKFLGKGGFAKCYELIDMDTRAIYAGKIVSKALLTKPHQKDKMAQEISIHRSLGHLHIVGFKSFFEDQDNVYIILELCRRRSLMELHKRRRAVTEPEARYFMKQIVEGCLYLHNNKVIHRDLKLGNLFLNDDMEIKIGDFGLATRVDYDGERKKTLCGTPNYIAPEVLGKKGHSYEVDVWSLGCILYTMLIGKPPFETSCLKDTYMRIKKNEFHIPSGRMSSSARNLIMKLLRAEPTTRPSIQQVIEDEFFTSGFLPNRLPTSCLTMAPRFDQLSKADKLLNKPEPVLSRRPLIELNDHGDAGSRVSTKDKKPQPSSKPEYQRQDSDQPTDYYLADLFGQVCAVLNSKPNLRGGMLQQDESEDPASAPVYWVSKWVDYSDKYGLGYQLCDNSVGVLFNDSTRLLLAPCGENIQYIERDLTEQLHTLVSYPEALLKKVTLLKYFRNYMNEHLLKAGANMTPREGDEMARMPFLRTWFRTKKAIVMHLSNGTLQINFFKDHAKVIICPLMGAVTYIDQHREFRTYRLEGIEKNGCSSDLVERLDYVRLMVERLMIAKSGSAKVKSATQGNEYGIGVTA